MSFRLVAKSVTLIGIMAVTLRYFTEFGKPAFQHITTSTGGAIYARVYCTLCLRKTSPTFLAITRESMDGFL